MSEWTFWQNQLSGGEPDTQGEGFPEFGFYEGMWRKTIPNPAPKVGEPRRKIEKIPQVYAIWKSDVGEWLCRIDSPEGVRIAEGLENVDRIFAVSCRKAISFETYTQKVNEYEQRRNNRTEATDADERGKSGGNSAADDGGRIPAGESSVHGGHGPEGARYA